MYPQISKEKEVRNRDSKITACRLTDEQNLLILKMAKELCRNLDDYRVQGKT